jgi:hypothetical protein
MPTLHSVLNLLSHPSRIPERLVERRMLANTMRVNREQTAEMTEAERTAFFAPIADIRPLAEEFNEFPLKEQLIDLRRTGDPDLRIASSQTSAVEDCLTIYAAVRIWKPHVMVETGVFYGAMSATILYAMKKNGFGKLYSIDLPVEKFGLRMDLRGALVPEVLRSNWWLILGDSRVELPKLLQQLGTIDAFNHDSLHTTQHMTWEYETAWAHLRSGGFLSSHDVLMTPSWERFGRAHASEIKRMGRVFCTGIATKR